MLNETMPHWLTKQAELSPHKIAIENTDDRTLSFLQLEQESKTFAKKIATLGIGENAKVAILSTNRTDMVIAIHALSYLKAVAVLLNTRLSKQELQYQLKQSETTLVITTERLRNDKKLDFPLQKTYSDIQVLNEAEIKLPTQINVQDPFTMMFTSGTTGNPKGVIHTYGNHWASAIGSMLNLGLNKDDKWLLTLPIFHVGGLSILLRSVIYGMTVFLMEKYDSNQFYETIMEKKITIISLVTLMLKQFLKKVGKTPLPNHVRCFLLGGGSVPEPILKQVAEKQIPLFQSYGMTETSSQIVTLSADYAFEKLGSAGKPLFQAALKIWNQNEEGIGEIVVKGPMVMKGYVNNEQANESSFEDGWFKTGDLGYLDEDNFLYVVDRRTDLIISGGENIYPSEIENVILGVEGIVEVAVIGRKDETWGQVPVAFVVRSCSDVSQQMIDEHIKTKLASFKLPKKMYFVQSLPRNASNKIMRHKLKDLLEE